jgi:hypothetical protein
MLNSLTAGDFYGYSFNYFGSISTYQRDMTANRNGDILNVISEGVYGA